MQHSQEIRTAFARRRVGKRFNPCRRCTFGRLGSGNYGPGCSRPESHDDFLLLGVCDLGGSHFVTSTLSHYLIHQPALLKRLRAWDQGLIYVMISGTYTPLLWRYAEDPVHDSIAGSHLGGGGGFHSKVIKHYRVNASGTISYLLLGWLPSLGLIGKVPFGLLLWMLAGAIAYVFGVSLLVNDRKRKYLHAGWHCCVLLAATCHYLGVYQYVATS